MWQAIKQQIKEEIENNFLLFILKSMGLFGLGIILLVMTRMAVFVMFNI